MQSKLTLLLLFCQSIIYAKGLQKIKEFPLAQGTSTTGHGEVMAAVNDKLFFLINDNTHGVEPWVSDGTLTGTQLLKDVNPIGSGFSGRSTVFMGGNIYFPVYDGLSHYIMYKTDGTPLGTSLAFSRDDDLLQATNNKILFYGE